MKKQNTVFTFHFLALTIFSVSSVFSVAGNQSKMINYAKQTQFLKKSNIHNPNFNNEL